MIDTEMMYRLCAALSDHTSVVLQLGDVEQLPSVGAGQVYKELIEKCPAQTAKLTKSFRMREDDPQAEPSYNLPMRSATAWIQRR